MTKSAWCLTVGASVHDITADLIKFQKELEAIRTQANSSGQKGTKDEQAQNFQAETMTTVQQSMAELVGKIQGSKLCECIPPRHSNATMLMCVPAVLQTPMRLGS